MKKEGDVYHIIVGALTNVSDAAFEKMQQKALKGEIKTEYLHPSGKKSAGQIIKLERAADGKHIVGHFKPNDNFLAMFEQFSDEKKPKVEFSVRTATRQDRPKDPRQILTYNVVGFEP